LKDGLLDFTKTKFKTLKTELTDLKEKMEKYREYYPKLDKLADEKTGLCTQVTQQKNNKDNIYLENFVEKTQEEIEEKEKDVPAYQEQIHDYEIDLANHDFLVNALDIKNDKGVKSYIMGVNLPILNQRLESYLVSIFPFPMPVRFNHQFDETIMIRGKEVPYSNLSGGEKKRLDLAINLTLFDLVRLNFSKTNLLILDEVLDALDKEGQQAFLNIFKSISENYAVYLISHSDWIKDIENPEEAKDSLKDLFDQLIMIEKENNFSRLKVL